MPRRDGLNVLEQIADRRIHVGNDLGLIVEAMRRRALDCVIKPTPVESFLLVLDETMERHWARELGLPHFRNGAGTIWRGPESDQRTMSLTGQPN
jgi:hypothetical protein